MNRLKDRIGYWERLKDRRKDWETQRKTEKHKERLRNTKKDWETKRKTEKQKRKTGRQKERLRNERKESSKGRRLTRENLARGIHTRSMQTTPELGTPLSLASATGWVTRTPGCHRLCAAPINPVGRRPEGNRTTHGGRVYGVNDAHWRPQNGSLHGRVFLTFKPRFVM